MDALYVAVLASSLAVAPQDQSPGFGSHEQFSVFAPTKQMAADVAQQAASIRERIMREWLSADTVVARHPVTIHVTLSNSATEGRTRPLRHSAGRSYLVRITAESDDVSAILAHELAHVVLDEALPGGLPVWANEAIACLQEPVAWRERRQRILSASVVKGALPSAASLFQATNFAAHDHTSYGYATAITEFLIVRGGKKKFIEFAATGPTIGWDVALDRAYQIKNTAALQTACLEWSVRTQPASNLAGTGKRIESSVEPRRRETGPTASDRGVLFR